MQLEISRYRKTRAYKEDCSALRREASTKNLVKIDIHIRIEVPAMETGLDVASHTL
jgi:hypothetical protein